MLVPRRSLALTALALALAGCGAADAVAPPAQPPAPQPATEAPAPKDPPAAAQIFAEADPGLSFRDPDRRRKLASAFAKIDAVGEDELKKQGLPSVAIGVVVDGELAYAKGFGAPGGDGKGKPDADTVYRIGSITKSFTAAALISLRDEGALALDDPLAKWIPEAAGLVYPTRDTPPITLRQMLTHTSGLPRVGPLPGARTDRGPTEEELLQSLHGLPLESPPGTKHSYSNLGFALLGIVVSRAAHAPYREVVNRRVLAPLGMTSTFWDQASVPPGRLATAFAKGPLGVPVPTPHWILGAEEGAGGLYSTVRDMAKYLAFQLAAYPPRSAPEAGPVRRSSVREGHFNALWDDLHVRPVHAPRKGESLVDAAAYRYGYGWVAEQTCELDKLVWHNGGIDGYRTDVAFLPEQGVGVIALVNFAGAAPEPIVERVIKELRRSGGLSKRTPEVAPAFAPVMAKLLDVYNTWDEGKYQAMLTMGRPPVLNEEKAELGGYKKLHGACKGYAPADVTGPRTAWFRMDCERGTLDMEIVLGADGLIAGFVGRSRDLPVPPEIRKIADRVVGLVKKWDDGVFKKHLAQTKRPREDAAKYFDDLRAVHGTCGVKSLTNFGTDRRILVECERGGDLSLNLSVDPKDADAVTSYAFDGVGQGTCPVR
jgi:CubicO group peptidase (beta-lactamase class C family)